MVEDGQSVGIGWSKIKITGLAVPSQRSCDPRVYYGYVVGLEMSNTIFIMSMFVALGGFCGNHSNRGNWEITKIWGDDIKSKMLLASTVQQWILVCNSTSSTSYFFSLIIFIYCTKTFIRPLSEMNMWIHCLPCQGGEPLRYKELLMQSYPGSHIDDTHLMS